MTALVIGLGNTERGDDAVGRQVARLVSAQRPDVGVVELDDPSEALDAWEAADIVVVTDAMTSDGEPGDIRVVDAGARTLQAGTWASGGTHAFGLAAAVELARALGRLPRRLLLVGVEAKHFDHGTAMSDDVAAAVPAAAAAVSLRSTTRPTTLEVAPQWPVSNLSPWSSARTCAPK